MTYPHEYVFKACWAATAIEMKVEGYNYSHALDRAERQILKMEGGIYCNEIRFIMQTR